MGTMDEPPKRHESIGLGESFMKRRMKQQQQASKTEPEEVAAERLTLGNDETEAKYQVRKKGADVSKGKTPYKYSVGAVASTATLKEAPTERLSVDSTVRGPKRTYYAPEEGMEEDEDEDEPIDRVGAYRVGTSNEERIMNPGRLVPAPLGQESMRMGAAPRHHRTSNAEHNIEEASMTSSSIYTSPTEPSIHAELVKPPALAAAVAFNHIEEAPESALATDNGRDQQRTNRAEMESLRNQVYRNADRNNLLIIFLIIVLIIAVGVAVTVTMLVVSGGGDESPSPGPGVAGTETPTVSAPLTAAPVAPTPLTAAPVAPTMKPTPTAPLDREELENQITLKSPNTELDAAGTPQRLALDWLSSDGYSQSLMQAGDLTKVLQRFGLAVFYFATNGPGWSDSSNWLDGNDACGLWFGIDCTDGLVSRIDMQSNKIEGTIPIEMLIFTQDTVDSFNLARNGLIDSIPSHIGSLRRLTDLLLFENDLDGMIPTEIANLSLLRRLAINLNQLSGPVPPLPSLGLLTFLDVRDNKALQGPLPDNGLEGLASIEELYIFGTDLTGSLSNELCDTLDAAWIDCGEVSCDCCTADLGVACPSTAPLPTSSPSIMPVFASVAPVVSDTPVPTPGTTPTPLPTTSDSGETPFPSTTTSAPVRTPAPSTPFPTISPTPEPTIDSVISTDPPSPDKREAIIRAVLESNGVPVKTDSSPQGQAFQYMVSESFLDDNDRRMLQRYSLLVLWFSTDGPTGWVDEHRGNWATSSDHCDWDRVTCEGSDLLIQKLQLCCGSVSSSIPTEIGMLDSMRLLDLHRSTLLTGFIPSEIGRMSALTWLDLGDLTGLTPSTIPQEILLETVEWLGLAGSQVTGIIPTRISRLSSITDLYIFDNELTGGDLNDLCDTLESGIIDCDDGIECECCKQGLRPTVHGFAVGEDCTSPPTEPPSPNPSLRPTEDTIEDTIEAAIRDLLERNGVAVKTDSSPQGQAFQHMVADSFLVDNDQRMVQRYSLLVLWFATDGPSSWSQMPWIDDSAGGWASPSDHCSWSRIECFGNSLVEKIRLNCGDDGFCGGIRGQLPTELGLIKTMKLIDFHFNTAITGTLPKEIGSLTALTWLDLNGLTGLSPGPVPDYLFVPSLEFLGLSNSRYTGSLSASINDLNQLQELYLFDNDITGGNLNGLCDTLESPAAIDCDDGIVCDCCREGDALWVFGSECPSSR